MDSTQVVKYQVLEMPYACLYGSCYSSKFIRVDKYTDMCISCLTSHLVSIPYKDIKHYTTTRYVILFDL
jgi:hypothetical protein